MASILNGYEDGYRTVKHMRNRRQARNVVARLRRFREYVASYRPLQSDDESMRDEVLIWIDLYLDSFRRGAREAILREDK